MSDAKSKDNRSRLWATVVYPESAPENWIDILRDKMVPCFVSPLHDKDINADGSPKKAHYHVLFIFDGNKSQAQIKTLCESFNGVGQERVGSKRGYSRYLCHLDNPEKAQYSPTDVKAFCGLDYDLEVGAVINKYAVIKEMARFVNDMDIIYFSDLFEYAMLNEPLWLRVLSDNGAFVMDKYIKSRAYKKIDLDQNN